MQPELVDLIDRRKRKAIKTILRVKDRVADPHLPSPAAEELRRTVLEEVNDLCDLFVDVIDRVADDRWMINGIVLERIEALHAALVDADNA